MCGAFDVPANVLYIPSDAADCVAACAGDGPEDGGQEKKNDAFG